MLPHFKTTSISSLGEVSFLSIYCQANPDDWPLLDVLPNMSRKYFAKKIKKFNLHLKKESGSCFIFRTCEEYYVTVLDKSHLKYSFFFPLGTLDSVITTDILTPSHY